MGFYERRLMRLLRMQGRIPKNNFGNIDLYTPSMLPAGAAYIPRAPRISYPCMLADLRLMRTLLLLCVDKGAAKIARQLGFDYAEAVVSELILIKP